MATLWSDAFSSFSICFLCRITETEGPCAIWVRISIKGEIQSVDGTDWRVKDVKGFHWNKYARITAAERRQRIDGSDERSSKTVDDGGGGEEEGGGVRNETRNWISDLSPRERLINTFSFSMCVFFDRIYVTFSRSVSISRTNDWRSSEESSFKMLSYLPMQIRYDERTFVKIWPKLFMR